jgi:adenine-specific DNA-methyltransferase
VPHEQAFDPAALPQETLRKHRGAFFTPPAIADYLAAWGVGGSPSARVLDPSCGDGVFLLAAAGRLKELGCQTSSLDEHVFGVDIHRPSLEDAAALLEEERLGAHLVADDFFNLAAPTELGCVLPEMDAVIGNPPFIRYQDHAGEVRARSRQAALRQGVRLSGLASSWAALLVHSCAFLKPNGRLAMVLPAELLTVHYAEPIRRWLRRRFAAVHLVMFDRLQFDDALEKVVLVLARGEGGCDAFSLYEVEDAADLPNIGAFDGFDVTPALEGKWTDMLLPPRQRQLFRRAVEEHFTPLAEYGPPELGTVTGANSFFTLTERTRRDFGLDERFLRKISPPGTRHLRGLSFTAGNWNKLKDDGERVWLLCPDPEARSARLTRYLAHGEEEGVPDAYKCQVRDPWWRPPVVSPPDLFFTYMSHRYPRLIANTAGVTFVNSMHGVRLDPAIRSIARAALPLLTLNSVTMLGAELFGRSYGGGVLKMEPREAGALPLPSARALAQAWDRLRDERGRLDRQLRDGRWTGVVKRVDEVLLRDTLDLSVADIADVRAAMASLRERRLGRDSTASHEH